MRRLLVILFVLLVVLPSNALAQSIPDCQFVLGFKVLHDLVPGIVGDCLTDEGHNPANGDGLQQTTKGLLVWRKFDNWTAFTDGYQTWINGPYGLQQRLNAQRFVWEGRPGGTVYTGIGETPSMTWPPNGAQPCFDAQPTPIDILHRLYPVTASIALACGDISSVLAPDIFTAAASFADADPFCRCQNTTDRQDFTSIDGGRYLVTLHWGTTATTYTVHFAYVAGGWVVTDIRCGSDLPNTSLLIHSSARC